MDGKEVFEQLNRTFDEFIKRNDERLNQIEKKGFSDPLLEEQVNKLNDKLTSLEVKNQELSSKNDELYNELINLKRIGKTGEDTLAIEKKNLDNFIRKGSLNIATDGAGGYLVPEIISSEIAILKATRVAMRPICNVVSSSSADFKYTVDTTGVTAGWVADSATRTATDAPTFNQVTITAHELYTNIPVSDNAIADSAYDVVSHLIKQAADKFAYYEGLGFTSGNNSGQPSGFLNNTPSTDVDGTRTYGNLQYVKTGVAGAFITTSATASPNDTVEDLMAALAIPYRQNAVFMMNPAIFAAVRKWKDNNGASMVFPSIAPGVPSTLHGAPVILNPHMASSGDDAYVIAYGDFKQGYTIHERAGVTIKRIETAGFANFYIKVRVGGALVDSNAIKLLRLAD